MAKKYPRSHDGLNIDSVGGYTPCQGYGTMAGFPFYFRARHGIWTLHVVPPGQNTVAPEGIILHHATGDDPAEGYMEQYSAIAILKAEYAKFLPKVEARTILERPMEHWTSHQVERIARVDCLGNGAMHLYRNIPALRLTYQIRILTYMASRDWSALVIHVHAGTHISDDLRAHVASHVGLVMIESDMEDPAAHTPFYLGDGEEARKLAPMGDPRGQYFAVFASDEWDDEVDGLEVAHYWHSDWSDGRLDSFNFSMFNAFIDAVVAHAEGGLRGTRFPLLTLPAMPEGVWSPSHSEVLCGNLEEIGRIFSKLPAPTGRTLIAITEHLGRTPMDLGECFFDVDREPLIEGLLALAKTAVRVGRPIIIQ